MSTGTRVETGRGAGLVRVGLAMGALAAALPAAAQDTAPPQPNLKKWTQGTTHAANEVVGSRSGLGFAFLPPGPIQPPDDDVPPPTNDMPELTVTGNVVAALVQIMDLSAQPPPTNDLPPGPVAIRVRLLPPSPILPPGPTLPPGPYTPARIELQLLDMTDVTLLGPSGQPLALCSSTGGQ